MCFNCIGWKNKAEEGL